MKKKKEERKLWTGSSQRMKSEFLKYRNSLAFRDCILKADGRISTLTRLVVYKLLETTSGTGRDEEQCGQSHSVCGNANRFNYFGKQFGIISKS